ncbi:MAG: RagB/SusD family nutrient uptake outer membrane protein, partial [Bacteroidales bacterium]|nr:RagB/SusD family nutrient uptake outer membrane protein [Bacteroidales bacterium]
RTVSGGKIVDKTPLIWTKTAAKHPGYKKFTMATNMLLGLWNNVTGFRAVEVYRYAEVLLIYAEASARASGGIATPEAIEAFNQIKRRAAGLTYNQAASSVDVPSATADEIFAEKGWELAGEGKRWYDLVRMEKVAEVTARRDPTEEVVLAKSASAITWKQYIAPIPFSTISTSKLIQNPEGFKAIQ